MRPGPNVKTVARAAGVSPASVSNAYNRPERLSAEVRARIFAIAHEQGYAGPDPAARSLRTGRAGAIGVIFTVQLSYAFSDPYCLSMLAGLTEVSERTRTGLVLIPIAAPNAALDDAEVRESLEAVQRAVIDGAVADGLDDDHPAVRALTDRGVPLVRSSESRDGRCVTIDDRAAGRSVGRHLARLGHRDVTVVVASPSEPGQAAPVDDESILYRYSRLRLAGIREGLGPAARVRAVSGGRNATESGRAAAALILDRPDRPSAMAADSDVMALGVLEAVRLRGLEPGRDISVTGFDDLPAAEAAGLTTIRQPIREKGRLMGQMLLEPSFTERRVVLPTKLVIRSTTGPAAHSRPAATFVPTGPAPEVRPARNRPDRPQGADEWEIHRLDLDAYLRRICYAGSLDPSGQTLMALHRAHIAAIAFENLDVMLGRGIRVDLESIQAKLVHQRRGGYCYEHGVLFAAALERLGYGVDRLLARTGGNAPPLRPRSHLVLCVQAGDRRWLADVGFGSGLLEPLPLAPAGPRRQGGWTYELVSAGPGAWQLREQQGKDWVPLYGFTEEPQHAVDIEVANHYTSTYPLSPFLRQPIAVRKDESAVRRLLGRQFALVRPDQSVQEHQLADSDIAQTLRDEFGVSLSAAEVAALTATLPPSPASQGPELGSASGGSQTELP